MLFGFFIFFTQVIQVFNLFLRFHYKLRYYIRCLFKQVFFAVTFVLLQSLPIGLKFAVLQKRLHLDPQFFYIEPAVWTMMVRKGHRDLVHPQISKKCLKISRLLFLIRAFSWLRRLYLSIYGGRSFRTARMVRSGPN